MATMLSLGIKVPVVSVSSRRHATRTVRASDKHHATDSSGSALSPPASGEKFVTVSSVLQQAAEMGDNFVFEDNDEDSPIWTFEDRMAGDASQRTAEAATAEPRGVLDPQMADVLSAYSTEQGFTETSVHELREALDDDRGVVLLDVRTEAEYAGGHVPGAINVPLDSLSAAVKSGQLDEHRDSQVAVVCQSGRRSAQATVKLTKVFGWPTVVNVQGGTLAWISAGFDTAA